MKTQTIKNKALLHGGLMMTALCLLLVSALAQQPKPKQIKKNEIIAVQIKLRTLGYSAIIITGRQDAATTEAVKDYQKKNSLPVSGGIDSATYEKLGLTYPAPDPDDPNVAERAGGAIKETARYGLEKSWDAGALAASKSKEGGRYVLEKSWDAGAFATSKSKDAAKASWKGTKSAGRASGRKTVSMIRRNDEGIRRELAELFFDHNDWNGVDYSIDDGMVTLKFPAKSTVDVSSVVSEVRKIAGVRSVFVVLL
ncbi:MAG: peptidoglycan-binding domain-containing protein [Blastocatellia bacterium]